VTFTVDADGILRVSAREETTGIAAAVDVKPTYGLTDEEVERMLIESFEHAEADFEARLLIEARNESEAVVNAAERSLRRPDFDELVGDDLAPGELTRIEAALAATRAAMAGTDRDRIHEATHELNHATRHLAELMMNRSVREALTGKNVHDV